jgi:hypothetical protein
MELTTVCGWCSTSPTRLECTSKTCPTDRAELAQMASEGKVDWVVEIISESDRT